MKGIKISILKDGDKYAYMEYQSGNDPKVFNDTYGLGGFWDIDDVVQALKETYSNNGEEFILSINL